MQNDKDITTFTQDVIDFLLFDNSTEVKNNLEKNFPIKMDEDEFIGYKKILLVALKEFGMSHVLIGRIIESFSELDGIYLPNRDWELKTNRKWWKMWLVR